ncbi:MAG TPA: hypothetical protein VLL52_01440, partial [Anaerolineae bacterium]|nr:hypothetical protein [Anaerolineae bacterium]
MVASMDDLEGVEGEEMVEQVVVDKVDGGDGEDGEQEVLLETVSIAGFWRRVGAVVVDWLLMGVVLWILALSLGEIAYRLGPWGRLVGYSLAVLYWGYGNSEQ